MDPYSISDFAEEAQRIVLLHEKSELILERLPPLLLRLASGRTWFDPKMLQPTLANGAGVYPLFDAPGPGLSVRAVSLQPGADLGPHNHGTWEVGAYVLGSVEHTFWTRRDDGTREGFADLKPAETRHCAVGDVVSFLSETIHSVKNLGAEPSLELQVNSVSLRHVERFAFNPQTNTVRTIRQLDRVAG